jgi:aspartyl-tRNA(Asn)/glutamyl-tRNA(Gln) amidotransferase subunit A
MSERELCRKTVSEIGKLYRDREVSVTEVVSAVLRRIESSNASIGAFSCIRGEEALSRARQMDDEGVPENASMLWGIPVALKENMCARDFPATCGSRILEHFVSPYDGAMSTRLQKAGALLLGTCRMDEFAMGSSSETNAFGSVRNPFDLDRVPGGSSGGSAAGVAAEMIPAALGSDTGGSIRQPCSFCGAVGLKPTYGLVSRFGLVAYASSLDQIGPVTRSVEDAALVLGEIAGHDPRDSTSYPQPPKNWTENLDRDLAGMKIGVPREYFTRGIAPDVLECVENARDRFSELGCEIVEVSLPHTEYAIAAYYILATAEASANLARFDGIRYGSRAPECADLKEVYLRSRSAGFGAEVKRRIVLGTFVLSSGYYDAYYRKAQKVRTFVKRDFDDAFQNVDLLLTPTSPCTAFRFGEKTDDPVSMYLSDIYTVSVNLAGLPALSVPCGRDRRGLPVGLQLIAPSLGEERLLNAGHRFEKAAPFSREGLKV